MNSSAEDGFHTGALLHLADDRHAAGGAWHTRQEEPMGSRFTDPRPAGRWSTRGTLRGAVLVALLAGIAGCSDENGSLDGSWLGTFTQEAQERAGTMRLTLSHSGDTLGGRWEAEFPPAAPYGGVVEGSVAGSTVRARLIPDDPEVCPYDWTATSGADRLSGRYAAFDCRVEIVGEIDVRRQ